MSVARALAAALALSAMLVTPAVAQPAPPAPPAARRKLVLAPLAALGSEATSAGLRRTEKLLISSLGALEGVDLLPTGAASEALKKRPELRVCDGEVACLSDLGALVGAEQVVYAEQGGLGDAEVVYLKLVDVAARREVRSTTLELGAGQRERAAKAGATRLVVPGRYVGGLELALSVSGATVYIDGEKVAAPAGKPLSLAVGDHALRVTHPEYRDFVRFVDVGFGVTQTLAVALERYAVVDRELAREGGGPVVVGASGGERIVPAPWYRRWYTIAGGGALLFIGSALVIGALADGVDADSQRELP